MRCELKIATSSSPGRARLWRHRARQATGLSHRCCQPIARLRAPVCQPCRRHGPADSRKPSNNGFSVSCPLGKVRKGVSCASKTFFSVKIVTSIGFCLLPPHAPLWGARATCGVWQGRYCRTADDTSSLHTTLPQPGDHSPCMPCLSFVHAFGLPAGVCDVGVWASAGVGAWVLVCACARVCLHISPRLSQN